MIHGDVRADNILAAGDGNSVWIIDFEYAEIVEERDSSKKSKISEETQAVRELLKEIKSNQGGGASHQDLREDISQIGTRVVSTLGEVH